MFEQIIHYFDQCQRIADLIVGFATIMRAPAPRLETLHIDLYDNSDSCLEYLDSYPALTELSIKNPLKFRTTLRTHLPSLTRLYLMEVFMDAKLCIILNFLQDVPCLEYLILEQFYEDGTYEASGPMLTLPNLRTTVLAVSPRQTHSFLYSLSSDLTRLEELRADLLFT
jgi:hypothetical protein